MNSNLNIKAVVGATNVLLSRPLKALLTECGIFEDDWDLLIQPNCWLGADRLRVTRTLHALCYGVCDSLGLPRFDLPSEFLLAVVSISVRPVNYFSAAHWIGSAPTTADLLHGEAPPGGFDVVDPSNFFAGLCFASGDTSLQGLQLAYQTKTKIALALISKEA